MDHNRYIQRTLELAKESFDKGGFPCGALIVLDGEIISEAISIGNILHDPTCHAELVAIGNACKKLKTTSLAGATLYESVESCVMCFSAANWAGISKIVYTGRKTLELVEKRIYEGKTSNKTLNEDNNHVIETLYIPDFEEESKQLISEWEKSFT
jgi:tRNA(Arg) A34 adenosine deaminase TadA